MAPPKLSNLICKDIFRLIKVTVIIVNDNNPKKIKTSKKIVGGPYSERSSVVSKHFDFHSSFIHLSLKA